MPDLVASFRGASTRLTSRAGPCSHLDAIGDVAPKTGGCEECLAAGMRWVHLRLCLSCGHVGCCDQSEGKHARAHYEQTGHPIVRSHEPGETWRWCWVDQVQI